MIFFMMLSPRIYVQNQSFFSNRLLDVHVVILEVRNQNKTFRSECSKANLTNCITNMGVINQDNFRSSSMRAASRTPLLLFLRRMIFYLCRYKHLYCYLNQGNLSIFAIHDSCAVGSLW